VTTLADLASIQADMNKRLSRENLKAALAIDAMTTIACYSRPFEIPGRKVRRSA